ncbi:MAG: hypothetical protein P8X43_12300 [Maritimibacter sp.]
MVRVNGTAIISADAELTERFEQRGKHPKTVIVVTVGEVYFQCAKAVMRAGLCIRGDESAKLPSAGDFIKEVDAGFDAVSYDQNYPESAKSRMW